MNFISFIRTFPTPTHSMPNRSTQCWRIWYEDPQGHTKVDSTSTHGRRRSQHRLKPPSTACAFTVAAVRPSVCPFVASTDLATRSDISRWSSYGAVSQCNMQVMRLSNANAGVVPSRLIRTTYLFN